MAESKRSIKLTSLDDLFSTEESRAEAGKERIQDIPIAEIDDFPDHPFHVDIDDAMREMAESVKRFGVLSPAVARQKEDGRYELISGHRRKKACELAGMEKMPVIVRNMDRDEAIIFIENFISNSIRYVSCTASAETHTAQYAICKSPEKQGSFAMTRAAYNDTSAQSRLGSRTQPGCCRGGVNPMMTEASVSLICCPCASGSSVK